MAQAVAMPSGRNLRERVDIAEPGRFTGYAELFTQVQGAQSWRFGTGPERFIGGSFERYRGSSRYWGTLRRKRPWSFFGASKV